VRVVRLDKAFLSPSSVSLSNVSMSNSARELDENGSARCAAVVANARERRRLLGRHGLCKCCTTRDALMGVGGRRHTAGASDSSLNEASIGDV
jgi:hypothetical protein